MLVELAADTWRPRWYYVLKNKTSGKLYVGQTVRKDMSTYYGSGQYWISHCQKYGGYNRQNIEIVSSDWISSKTDADKWLSQFEGKNPGYFLRSNTLWANRAQETSNDSAFCGLTKEQRTEFAKLGRLAIEGTDAVSVGGKVQGAKNAESGHMASIQKIGCVLGGRAVGAKNIKKAWEMPNARQNCASGGYIACTQRHKEKDLETGKSSFAIKIGKLSGETKRLLALFCLENNIKKPGSNYVNVDRKAFNDWRVSNDRRVGACESSISSNQGGGTE